MEGPMKNRIERGPEHIPSKEEVLAIIARHTENTTLITKELSDEQGLLYSLETRTEGKKPGEFNEYLYTRRGVFTNHIQSLESVIHVAYYKDDFPISGTTIANYDSGAGEWKDVE